MAYDIAVAHGIDPFVSAYPWTPGGGFGAKYAAPGTKPTGTARGMAFCGSTDIAVAHSIDPFVSAYRWTPGGGFGAKYADPGTKPTGDGNSVAFSPEYTPTGWTGKIAGVTNPAKVMGVAVANIAKVKGVA